MKREEHTFQFLAEDIATAAQLEAEYHESREIYWRGEYSRSVERVKETASVKVIESPVTGGMRADVVVDHGDLVAYKRMAESFEKIRQHLDAAERYRTDARVYGTQNGRIYELDTADVHHFRLGGEPRED